MTNETVEGKYFTSMIDFDTEKQADFNMVNLRVRPQPIHNLKTEHLISSINHIKAISN